MVSRGGSGDLLLLQQPVARFPEALASAGLLPLAERRMQLGRRRPAWAPVSILAVAMLVLVAAMAVTPFLNNAATVLVMAPIGAGLARQLGLSPDRS